MDTSGARRDLFQYFSRQTTIGLELIHFCYFMEPHFKISDDKPLILMEGAIIDVWALRGTMKNQGPGSCRLNGQKWEEVRDGGT